MPVDVLADKSFAMFVSTFDLRKCHYLLVEVWALLSLSFPIESLPDLVLIGRKSHGWARAKQALANAPHIAKKVHIFHDMDDQQLVWCYKNCSFGLFPSITEGWGLGVSEFLAHGVPVLYSDIPILHEAAQNLMPSAEVENAEDWAEKIGEFLLNPELLPALRQRISAEYEPGEPNSFARCVYSYLKIQTLVDAKNDVQA